MASKFGYTVKTLQTITSSEISKLTAQQVKDLRKVANDALNKRYKRIANAGLSYVSPSYEQAVKVTEVTDGEIPHFRMPRGSTRNQDLKALYYEINLLNQQTSTVKGTQQFINNVTEGLVMGSALRAGKVITPDEKKNLLTRGRELFIARKQDRKFWSLVRGIMDGGDIRNMKFDSMDALKYANDVIVANPNASNEDLFKDMVNMLDKMQEEKDPIVGYEKRWGDEVHLSEIQQGVYSLDEITPIDGYDLNSEITGKDTDNIDDDSDGVWFKWDND